MTVISRWIRALALAGIALGPACGGSSTPFMAPTEAFTENFTGTVPQGSLDFKPFTTKVDGGEIDATLTSAGPPPGTTVFVGFALGAPSTDGTTCVLSSGLQTITTGGPTQQLPPATAQAGTFCVEVVDVQNIGPLDYAVTVVHH